MIRKGILAGAFAVAFALLASCSNSSAMTPTTSTTATTPSPSASSTPTATGVTPQPTETVTVTTFPLPTGTIKLRGEVVLINLVDAAGSCDEEYATDVVVAVADNSYGIRGVQYHDPEGEIGQGHSLGNTIRVTVTPDDYDITLEHGGETFNTSGHCVKGSVPDEMYGGLFLEGVPYNAATWKTLPTP